MAKETAIEWCDATFNVWWGCTEVGPACENCYARSESKRRGYNVWGKDAPRRFLSDAYWREPLKWNREARAAGERRRVFCSSMADVFERRPELNPWRERLWKLIEATPHLDWLLLTKRPEQVMKMVPTSWRQGWPPNAWIGATVENERYATKRIKHLLPIPAPVRFVSCEPLLGPVNLAPHLGQGPGRINWVIAGGESGAGCRPSDPEWFRNMRDQCTATRVPFFFKQWGNWAPSNESTISTKRHLTVFGQELKRFRSKYDPGRELDGRTWDEHPVVNIPQSWLETA